MSDPEEELFCMVLQTGLGKLLLPRSALCEVIAYSDPEAVAGSPEWMLGRVQWNGRAVPLLSLERMCEVLAPEVGTRTRIAVLTGLAGVSDIPCFAMLVQDHPVTVRPGPDALQVRDDEMPDCIRAAVVLDGEPMFIPDLEVLERRSASPHGTGEVAP